MTMLTMDQLVPGDDINSRTGADRKEGIVALAASIKEVGLILPLAVREVGGSDAVYYEIIDGHRRFAALQKLKWKELVPVNVVVADDARASAQSLIANVERLPLHPVDQHAAVERMIEHGFSSDRVMRTLNLTDLQLRRILALAKLSDKVRKAWRDEKLDAKQARTFAICTDVKKQDAILKELLAGKIYGDYDLRKQLTNNARVSQHIVAFCGVDALTAAGVQIVEDLFAENEANRYLLMGDDIADTVVTAKIEEVIAQLGAEGFALEYGQNENADYEAALDLPEWDESETPDFRNYFASLDRDKIAGLTWIIDFGWQGVEIDGPYRRTQIREDDGAEAAAPVARVLPTPAPAKEPDGMTVALRQDVLAWRTDAYRQAYAGQGAAFLRLMLHAASQLFFSGLRLTDSHDYKGDVWQFSSGVMLADQMATIYAPSISAHDDRSAVQLAQMLADTGRLYDFVLAAFRARAEEFFERSNIAAIRKAIDDMGLPQLPGEVKKSGLAKHAALKAIEQAWLPELLRVGLDPAAPFEAEDDPEVLGDHDGQPSEAQEWRDYDEAC